MEFLLDPTSYDSGSSSSFLTFSSFSDITQPTSHCLSDTWDDLFRPSLSFFDDACSSSSSSASPSPTFGSLSSFSSAGPPPKSFASLFGDSIPCPKPRTADSASSDYTASPELRYDPFEIASLSFEPSEAGPFHIAGSSKLSAADVNPGLTHRVSASTDSNSNWDSPLITPALNAPGFSSPQDAFSWDDAPSTLASSSSSYTPPTTAVHSAPHRIASNPTLGGSIKNPRGLKNISSMPALKEEVDSFAWFDAAGGVDGILEQSENVTDEALVDNFDWVFGDYGLGESLPLEGTIFAAFKEQESTLPALDASTPVTATGIVNAPTPTSAAPSTSTSAPLPSAPIFPSLQTSTSPIEAITDNSSSSLVHPTLSPVDDLSSWFTPTGDLTQVVSPPIQSGMGLPMQHSQSQGPSSQMYGSYAQNFTIDPAVLGGPAEATMAAASRPTSAPKVEGVEGLGLLSAPMAGAMSRSLTAPGFVPNRSAPPNLFSYDPQPLYSSPYLTQQPLPVQHQYQQQVPQPQPQQPQATYPPAQVLPIRSLPQRRASAHGLTISVNQPAYSTYTQPGDLPLTPQSAPFTSTSMSHAQAVAHAQSSYTPHLHQARSMGHLQPSVPMARAGTQPLPMTRRMSLAPAPAALAPSAQTGAPSMPAHLVRAQAIVQMQEAKEEQQRQELRRQAAARRVNMAEASVMQPLNPVPASIPAAVPMHQFQQQQQQQPRTQPTITGWEGPSSLPNQSHMPSGMTTQPLIVHPPPPYYAHGQSHPSQIQHPRIPAQQAHRVHPPPHPGMPSGVGMGVNVNVNAVASTSAARPMARLPSPKNPAIRKVTSPAKRSPSGAKARRAPMQPGGFSWGEATFINFTPDDAEKLLTGVAPSGSQAKRKREEDAARLAAGGLGAAGTGMMGMVGGGGAGEYLSFEMDREGSKRSRNGD